MDSFLAVVLLLSAMAMFQFRKIADLIKILSLQSVILALVAAIMGARTGIWQLFVASGLTLVIKAFLIPYILLFTIKKIGVKREVERFTSHHTALLIALALSAAGYYVTSHLNLPEIQYGQAYLSISIILIFLGTFIMIDHKKAVMQGIGLITVENGLFLVSQSISYGMPLVVEMGIFFDMLVTTVIIGILLMRIHTTFDSLNTENMKNLKG